MKEESWFAIRVAITLDDDPKGLRTVADESGLTERNARAGLRELLDRSLVTTTPGFKYRRSN